jgi:hypothetical protein
MYSQNLLRTKQAIFAAWGINLFRPDATAPIPPHILRRMGAI